MLIKLTNAADSVLKGNPLYINVDWIVSVYEVPRDSGSVRTIIYGGPQCITWEVEESLSEVEKKVNRTHGSLRQQ
jgi:hypothetical protein